MKTIVLLMVALLSFISSAQAAPKKSAFILVNWGAKAFYDEAIALDKQLKRLGWETYLFENFEKDGRTIQFIHAGATQRFVCPKDFCGWQAIIQSFLPLSAVKTGDRIWIDVQGDGTDLFASGEKLADGNSIGYGGLYITLNDALSYEEFAKTMEYPYHQAEMFASHSVEAYLKHGKKTSTGSDYLQYKFKDSSGNMVGTGDLRDLSKLYSGKGAKITVIDHSCQGGATARLLETLDDPNVCGIATTGVNSPGLQGFPPVSEHLKKSKPGDRTSMDDIRKFISSSLYTDSYFGHSVGNRFHQAGFATGCSQTMAVRELSDNAAGAYSAFWDWSRTRPSSVLRNPGYYTTLSTKTTGPSLDQPWTLATMANVQADFTKNAADDCARAGKNCNLKANPRLLIAEGWVRWFKESLANLKKDEREFDQFMSRAEVTVIMDKIQFDGGLLLGLIAEYKKLVDQLDESLTNEANWDHFQGTPLGSVDAYLRMALVQRCLCADAATVKALALVCPVPEKRVTFPSSFKDKETCANPVSLTDDMIGKITAKKGKNGEQLAAPLELLNKIRAMEKGTGPGGLGIIGTQLYIFSDDLNAFEKNCVSHSCQSQEI